MIHFEYMEQAGQFATFELLDECELIQFKQSSANICKPVKLKKLLMKILNW